MNTRNFAKHLVILTVLGVLAACGGGSSEPSADSTAPPASVTAVINAAGGTVTGPDGIQVVIPAGALDQPTEIGIARDGSSAPELGGLRLISSVYAITPHGTQFAESARISIPFNSADVAPGTQPIIIKSQPGGTWTALISDVTGNSMAADTSGLSYYAVGTCYTSRDVTVGGPDPLLYCPASHSLQLRLQDGSGASIPVPRSALGTQLPAMTISTLTTLNFNAEYNRPAGINRNDLLSVWVFGAGLLPSQQPLTDFVVNHTSIPPIWVVIDPSKVPLAGRPGGVVIRIKAWVTYTTDAFYPGCLCFKPASWTYEAEVPVRVIYNAPPVVTHTIGGTVGGLTGTGLVLRNNGGDNRAVTADGAFTFATAIGVGAPYSVTVLTQPAGQTCTVQNGSGTVNANVTNVAVTCVAAPNPLVAGVLSARAGHTCALKPDGSVACWGLNTSYQLGDGTSISKNSPVAVTGLSGVVAVAASTFHSCAIKADTSVVCWGANAAGQLGDGSGLTQASPVAVSGLSGVKALSGGRDHTCALKTDGSVACWGNNTFGQLGDGTSVAKPTPVAVSGLAGVVALSAGWDFTCAAKSDDSVVCWGRNDLSQLGDGTTVNKSAPVAVFGLSGAIGVSTGQYHACAPKADGGVACWGENSEGQLGDGTLVKKTTFVAVSGLTGVMAISTGSAHNCALKSDGGVACWGANSRGQIGDGTAGTAANKTTPVAVAGLSGVTALASGSAYNCVLKTDGSAACWGWNIDGSLGDASFVDKSVPTAVVGGAVFWK